MSQIHRRGPPKHLEKMLFINHKEDLMLDDKLSDLNLRSRLKVMELDRERIRVRNELRNSRKKNITINEAMSSGLLPDDTQRRSSITPHVQFLDRRSSTTLDLNLSSRRPSVSAPPRRKIGVVEQTPLDRSSTFIQPTNRRMSIKNQFSRQPVIAETDENNTEFNECGFRRDSVDTVGAYVLDEFEKMSQVVPDILRELAKKKEKQKEIDDRVAISEARKDIVCVNVLNYEPDMNKVRKTVSSVKKLRHRMSISKKLEASKPRKSLHQMIKDKTDNMGEYDEYTDGTCALMKRRLDKKRRDSAPAIFDGQLPQRRQSVFNSSPDDAPPLRRQSTTIGGAAVEQLRNRSASVVQLPSVLSRSSTNFGFGSSARLNTLGKDSDGGAQFIDEDELMNRKRIMKELENYDVLQERVDQFLVQAKPNRSAITTVMEEIIPIQ